MHEYLMSLRSTYSTWHTCMGLFSAKGILLVQHGHVELFAALHLLYSRCQLVKGVREAEVKSYDKCT